MISVIIPNFNHAIYLKERIESILAILPQGCELILIDDASEDNSWEIMRSFTNHDQVRTVKNLKNLGCNLSVSEGLSIASCPFVTFFAVDDIITPNFFSRNCKAIARNPNLILSCSDFGVQHDQYLVQERGIRISYSLLAAAEEIDYSPSEVAYLVKNCQFRVPGHTAVIRKSIAEEYGNLRDELGPRSDWFLLHSIALNEGATYIPETLAYWRIHKSNESHSLKNPLIAKKYDKIMKQLLEKTPSLAQKFYETGLLAKPS